MKNLFKYILGFTIVGVFLVTIDSEARPHSVSPSTKKSTETEKAERGTDISQPARAAAVLTKHILQETFKKLDIEIPIRVLLDEEKSLPGVHWKLGSQEGFLVLR